MANSLRWRARGWFVGDSEAERRLAAFCADVAEGKAPDPDYLATVAKALQFFLGEQKLAVQGVAVGKALGLARKQGKAKSAQKNWRLQAYAVVDYLENLDSMAEPEAIRAAADKHRIGERAMRDRIHKYADHARKLRDIDAMWKACAEKIEARLGSEKET